ncbi:hypothetical protein [Pseudomonas sp. LRF_L74]|uniref:hypothetical protein n=1 Tax=Pseudomonas sp. LRF_L74 TaxID=3369422 RepID=UPI003F6130E9
MLHAKVQDHLYRIAHDDEQQALVDAFAFNVQDPHWLVYCALGGHKHAAIADVDAHADFSLPLLLDAA